MILTSTSIFFSSPPLYHKQTQTNKWEHIDSEEGKEIPIISTAFQRPLYPIVLRLRMSTEKIYRRNSIIALNKINKERKNTNTHTAHQKSQIVDI